MIKIIKKIKGPEFSSTWQEDEVKEKKGKKLKRGSGKDKGRGQGGM